MNDAGARTASVGTRTLWTPVTFAAIIGVAAATVLPWLGRSVAPHPGFLPAVIAVVAGLDLLSVYVLLQQFRLKGERRVLAMAGAYTWSLLVMLGYAWSFPGIMPTASGPATSPSVSLWLWVAWQTGFPVLLGLAWGPWPGGLAADCRPQRRLRAAWCSQVVAAGAAIGVVAFVATRGTVPVIVQGLDTERMTALTAAVALPLVGLSVLLALRGLRRRRGPERWTSSVIWVGLLDLSLTSFSGHRYSVGWYAGGLLTVVAAGPVLLALLHESTGLRRTLAETLDRQRQVEDLQGTTLDHLSVAVILTDLSGGVLVANDAARKVFPGVVAGERPPQPRFLTPTGEPVPDDDGPAGRAAATGTARRSLVVVAVPTTGEEVWLSVNATPVRGHDGAPVAVLTSYADVSEGERGRRALEQSARRLEEARDEAVAATKAKSSFLATMSHEIRTPMNAVIGMTGLLLDTDLDAEQRDFAETVRNSGEALMILINDILDFSKIEAGDVEMERQPFEVRECIENACALVALVADGKDLELVADVDDSCPEVVVGDMTRFQQVVVNLLSNAVKFTPSGEIVVAASARWLGGEAHGVLRMEVSVRDTGIGIPADRMDRLFQTFSQVDSSTTRVYGGTGLGLVISRRLAEAMGGGLEAESEVDRGSTFTFTAILGAHVERRQPPSTPAVASLAGKSVLVVDDNATNRLVLQVLLSKWGMACTAVATASEALKLAEDGHRFDVAVLDYRMPVMDGQQLALALRELPAGPDLPLILLTSLQWRLAPDQQALFAATVVKPARTSLLRKNLLRAVAPADAVLAAIETAGGRRSSDAAVTPVVTPLRILLAEDNMVNQKVAQLMLAKLGHRVETVGNGLEAVEAVRRSTYDVVLMDVQMPELDGLEATRRIRAGRAADRQPHIIALTASVLAEDRAACEAAGMDAHLAKPIRSDELQEALRGAGATAPRP